MRYNKIFHESLLSKQKRQEKHNSSSQPHIA
jgi:hypothetical protein